jgi:hypothetical protein
MEICTAFFTLNIVCCYEMGQCVEVMSNLRVRKNLGEDSTHGLSALTFDRTFSSFTNIGLNLYLLSKHPGQFFASFCTPMFAQQVHRASNNSGKVPNSAILLQKAQ